MSLMIRNQRERIDVGPTGSATNRRKTGHVTRACNTCRRKKSKCDGKQPICKACYESGHECTWTAEEDSRRPATKQYVESLKNTNKVQQERIQQLEALLSASGLSVDNLPTEAKQTSRGGSPLSGLFANAPLPPSSQTHSPSGSFTADLPADAFLAVNDGGYDSISDPESDAENLSNAAARLVLSDGDLSVVGPSSLQFHRKSPITRTIPLEDSHEDAPKHTLIIGGDEGGQRTHSRSASFSHNRSRSQSQVRSAGHSRSSSVAPHGVTPPTGQIPPYTAATSGFGSLSPPTTGVPYFDPASPGSDSAGQEPNSIDQQFFAQSAFSPNTVQDEGEDRYDWRLMLPQDVELTRTEHDTLIDLFFKFFSSWCYRTIPDLFLRDMRRYLEGIETRLPENPQSPSDEKPVITGPKTVHYTPMLHNAILSIALAYSDDARLSRRSTRAKFVEKAKSTLEMECSRPSLACVQALAYIASFYSGEGEQTLGFLFFGMSIRMSQALGLSLDCSFWVRSGHISQLDEVDRVWTFWNTYCLDKCWTFYVGRDHGLPNPLMRLIQPTADSPAPNSLAPPPALTSPRVPTVEIYYPTPDEKVDNSTWEWKSTTALGWDVRRSVPNTPSIISSTFYQTCKLMVLATKVMNAIWKLPKNAGSDSIASIMLEVDAWLEELPDSMRITRPKTTQALPHILMINMAHQWLQILLHRPFYRVTQNKSDPSIKRCDSGAEKILQYLSAWRRLYGLRYVPITMVQIAFVAGTTCLLRAIQSVGMPEKRRGSLEGVREIVRALNEMGVTWKSAKQSAEALKVLLHEQVSANERSPGPSRHPTVELQPPSVGPSRAQTMDMAFELHGARIPLGGNILEESSIYAEPSNDLAMSDQFIPYPQTDSPGSHSGYFGGNEELNFGHHPSQSGGHFVSSSDGSGTLLPPFNSNLPGAGIQGGVPMGGEGFGFSYPQLGQFMGNNEARLRAGESFPNHPIGLFGQGPGQQGGDWFGQQYNVPGQGQQYWGQ